LLVIDLKPIFFKNFSKGKNSPKGTKLILAQHGGRYENIKNFFHIDYEVDISDYFISWGRKKNNSKINKIQSLILD